VNMIRYEQAGSVPVKSTPAADTLPALLDRAAAALVSAKSSAEVLEARDMARVAYDAAKSAGRLAKAKQAHDTVLAEVYRAQADALMIEARAKMRLAEEYDAAQDRGEIKTRADNQLIPDQNKLSPSEIDPALPKLAFEGRQLLKAEAADPGVTRRTLNEMVERGEEPTKANLNREIINKPKAEPQKVMDQSALWVWGRLKDFERDGILSKDPAFLISEMTEPMRADVKRISPLVRAFLENMEQFA
jgi:hypothetical protein